MMKLNVKTLIRACQNCLDSISVYRITSTDCSYDPMEDTELVGSYSANHSINNIPDEIGASEVHDFVVDDDLLYIYI